MLAMYPPVHLTGSCIIKGSVPALLATGLVKSIYYTTSLPHNDSVTLTATYTGNSSQSMCPKPCIQRECSAETKALSVNMSSKSNNLSG